MHRIIQNPALPVPPGLTALLLTISLALPACAREPASAPVAADSTGVTLYQAATGSQPFADSPVATPPVPQRGGACSS